MSITRDGSERMADNHYRPVQRGVLSMTRKAKLTGYSLAIIAMTVFASSAVDAQTRVYFARGATRATVCGYLRGMRDEASYVLGARPGQHRRVEMRGRGPTRC